MLSLLFGRGFDGAKCCDRECEQDRHRITSPASSRCPAGGSSAPKLQSHPLRHSYQYPPHLCHSHIHYAEFVKLPSAWYVSFYGIMNYLQETSHSDADTATEIILA